MDREKKLKTGQSILRHSGTIAFLLFVLLVSVGVILIVPGAMAKTTTVKSNGTAVEESAPNATLIFSGIGTIVLGIPFIYFLKLLFDGFGLIVISAADKIRKDDIPLENYSEEEADFERAGEFEDKLNESIEERKIQAHEEELKEKD